MPDVTTARLPRSFYQRDVITVARELLGQTLVRIIDGERLAGRLVEVEAYLGVDDRAAHTYGGRRTARNEAMWMDGGHSYVYFIYGMHHCMNVVAGKAGEPVAVLLRGLEPTEGIHAMFARRSKAKRETDLCSGPAKLAEALAIDRSLTGVDMVTDDRLFIEHSPTRCVSPTAVATSSRVGVAYAGAWASKPLRFFLTGNAHVSRP